MNRKLKDRLKARSHKIKKVSEKKRGDEKKHITYPGSVLCGSGGIGAGHLNASLLDQFL